MTTVAVRLPIYCPTWCLNDHQEGVNDGYAPEDCTEHRSSDFGRVLSTLSNPFTHEVIRPDGAGWWAQVYQPGGRDGWDSRTLVTVELRQSHDHDRKNAVVTFEPTEALELARVLTHLAEDAMLAGITPTKWAPGVLRGVTP